MSANLLSVNFFGSSDIPCCSCFDGSGGLLPLRLPILRYDTRYRSGAAVPDRAAGIVRRSDGWLYRVYDTGMAGQSLRLADGSFLADGAGGRL